jgi:hypothetical protein
MNIISPEKLNAFPEKHGEKDYPPPVDYGSPVKARL